AIIGIRPEDFADAALAPPGLGDSTLEVVPDICEAMGAEVYVHFTLGVLPLRRIDVAEAQTGDEEPVQQSAARHRSPFVARLARGSGAEEGRPLRLAVDVDRIYIFDAETG